MDELAKRTCHVCGAISQHGLGWCSDHGQDGLLRLCGDCDCTECVKEAEKKTPRTSKDSLAVVGALAILVLIIWLLSVAVDNMGPGGNAGYGVLAAMALFGVGWWFWRKLEDLK